ncbi:Erythroid differentiation-related factor 1 [Mactra antiquata]
MSKKLKEKEDNQLVPVCYGPSKAVVPLKSVKSDAEVRHGIVHFSTHIAPLRLHTDLNIPPSNWLRSSSKLEQHVRDLTWHSTKKPSQFSSIDMAHKSPDLTGEVDVITHSANIKKLLKIPFENSHISMMVHRVGKSLLLDEFDIHKHLLRKEQTEWSWLRQFYYESVLRDIQENMKCVPVPRQSKTRDNLQNMNLYSKFLYHSLCGSREDDVSEISRHTCIYNDDKAMIPDPLPKPMGSQTHRDVLWTFEDIKMLIGTDLPVFCDDSYCVSLRLSDMRTPVNVLTGLDYWLDNLMCNVPEVAMCFHVNGIVQKYELVKTEDIPDLENSRFDPTVVTDIAKNILSFLKNNATREGHTYWLYKGTNDDVVKLYDLTALCDEIPEKSSQNPFIVPLGMLLYRVARNMWTNETPGKTSLVRTLLENCLCLLDEKKHSQVYTSANYLLSDIYVPDSCLHDDWSLPNDSSDENSDEDNNYDGDDTTTTTTTHHVDVKTLSDTGRLSQSNELIRLKPFNETQAERCDEAIKCIHRGLGCLQYDLKVGKHRSSQIVEEQATCNSDEAIPLHYEPLIKTNISSTSVNKETLSLEKIPTVSVESKENDPQSWHTLSEGLLYRKAALAFSAMTKSCMVVDDMMKSYTYLKMALTCFDAFKCVLPQKVSENDGLLSCLLGLCGDIRLGLIKSNKTNIDWDQCMRQCTIEEQGIFEMVDRETTSLEFERLLNFDGDISDNVSICVECYDKALKLTSRKNLHVYIPLSKRKGNAYNELGVCYMQLAQKLLENEGIQNKPSENMVKLWTNGRQAFLHGIEVFEQIKDIANQALLHCNYGRLMRLCATTYTQIAVHSKLQEFTAKERFYFQQAIDEYKKALTLGNQGFKAIVESVKWELSTTYFNMASLLQDYAPLSSINKEEVEKEIITLMDNSLKYCKDETSFVNQPMYQFRAASVNHRLASLFHNTIRSDCTDQKRKHLRILAEKHYIKSTKLYQQMECHVEYLQAHLEYIALLESSLTGQTNMKRQKILSQILACLSYCKEPIKGLSVQLKEPESSQNLMVEAKTILNIIESRLQFTLQQLLKIFSTPLKKSKSSNTSENIEDLRSLYASSITIDKSKTCDSLTVKCDVLETLLEQVTSYCVKNGLSQDHGVT